MAILGIGVLLWAFVHLIPTIEQPLKARLVERLGAKGYRGVFALAILGSLVLIVTGWRSTPEEYLYVLPQWSRTAGFVLMILSFVLIGASHYKTAIKRVISHPMLTGVVVWSVAHLLMNGTTRALILFGGLGLWALIEIPLITRRDGAPEKPDAPGFSGELKGLIISAIIFMVVLFLHPYFSGVTPFPR
jgi:uncharacterized membrane protein